MPGGRGLIQINDSVPESAQHIQTLSEAKRGRTGYDHVNLVPVDGRSTWGKAVVTVAVETGDPASRIAEHVQANPVELIVMGRRGRGDLGGLPLGSVPHKVAQVAPFACMMVE